MSAEAVWMRSGAQHRNALGQMACIRQNDLEGTFSESPTAAFHLPLFPPPRRSSLDTLWAIACQPLDKTKGEEMEAVCPGGRTEGQRETDRQTK